MRPYATDPHSLRRSIRPPARPRPWHRTAGLRLLALGSVAALVALAIVMFRASAPLSPRALGQSVTDGVGGSMLFVEPCSRERGLGSAWTCGVVDGNSGGGEYRVVVRPDGCWTARAIDATTPLPRRASGCVAVRSERALLDRLMG